MTRLVVGVDGGGTKTHVIVADGKGAELSSVTGSASAVIPGEAEHSAEVIERLLRDALEACDMGDATVNALCIGVAGVGRDAEFTAFFKAISDRSLADELEVLPDAVVALEDAFADEPGILLIAGTGSVSYGRGPTGRLARCGGWGPTAGDEGSGAWIGRRALSVITASSDGREPETALLGAVLTHLQLGTPEELIPWAAAASPALLAQLATPVMAAAAGTLKRLNLELGGKSPAIVFPDCDIETVARQIAQGGMILCGQQCTGINRVLVHQACQKEIRSALSKALAAMPVGPLDDDATEIGPLINFASRDRIAALVSEAAKNGTALLQGHIPGGALAKGAYITPSLLAVQDLASSAVQEEFFGPVMNIETFSDEADAVRKANATRYGLAASVWTGDLARGHRIARALRSGTVWINDHNRLYPEVEMGGFRESGYGRLHGRGGLAEFLATKHIYQNHGRL